MKKNFKNLLSIVTLVIFFLIAIASGDDKTKDEAGKKNDENSEIVNGEGNIKHNTADDWNTDATLRELGKEVWKFCQKHPDASKLTLTVIDECKDMKGNQSNYESIIIFETDKIKEFATYKDYDSFNQNCFEFGFAIATGWKPCGGSLAK